MEKIIIMEKKKEILEKSLRIRPNKEMRERRTFSGIRTKREKERKDN